MSDFTLDTSGAVSGPIGAVIPGAVMLIRWPDLSPFEQGYVEALFASLPRWHPEHSPVLPVPAPEGSSSVVARVGFSDLAPSTLEAIRKDCAEIEAHLAKTWADAMKWSKAEDHPEFPDTGAKAWAWRQAGFARQAFPPLPVTLGDDGLVYQEVKS